MAEELSVTTIYRRTNLANLTSGAVNTIPPIGFVAFGDGGVDGNGKPIPPSTEATALSNEIARYPIDSVEYPKPTTARYKCTIPKDALAGVEINEVALVDDEVSGGVCAIRTMYPKRKDPGVAFIFTFDDEF